MSNFILFLDLLNFSFMNIYKTLKEDSLRILETIYLLKRHSKDNPKTKYTGTRVIIKRIQQLKDQGGTQNLIQNVSLEKRNQGVKDKCIIM